MTSLPTTTRQVHLAARPKGAPTPTDFRLVEDVPVPDLKDGQILVANTVMSVDPYMRGRMNDTPSYIPPFQLDQPMEGGAVGTVIASRSADHPEGTSVLHMQGWREHAVVDGAQARRVDTSGFSDGAYLGVLGMPGLTAYAGLMRAAEFAPGDAVFVSGAAGAVGSLVGQIARLAGASRVVGSAGTPEKVARLKELGFDAAFNYRDGSVTDQLAEAAPDGIDVYFDNVGGDHLEAALAQMNNNGRIAVCGLIAQYNSEDPPAAPRNLEQLIKKCLTVRGFVVSKYAEEVGPEFTRRMGEWVAAGQITWDETYRDGLESAPQAFMDLLQGANTGKMLVRLAPAQQG